VKWHEANPGPAKHWRDLGEHLVWDVLYPHAPDSYLEDPKADPHWEWVKDPDVREAVRPQIAEEARVARFLASEGLALNNEAYALLVDAVGDNLYPAFELLARRAAGDYSPDNTPESFPPFINGPAGKSEGIGCWDLFEAFVKAKKPADGTVQRWRAVFLKMQQQFADVGANGITEDAARAWIRGLVSEDRSARTVREVWLSSSRSVFSWGMDQNLVRNNPFATIKVDVPRRVQTRETGKAFTPEETQTILKASSACTNPKTPWERAKRWVPWLCAYSGARAGEITQLRGRDIEQRGGFYVMKLTPDAGPIKTRQTRTVPIHEHLIDQGFLKMVQEVGSGALFYNDQAPQRAHRGDPLKPSRSRAATTRAHLGEWVRSIGVNDPEISPNHAWRHTFKAQAARVGMDERYSDAITGHTPATTGRAYTKPIPEDLAEAMKKFPRYEFSDMQKFEPA
jgi:integrase